MNRFFVSLTLIAALFVCFTGCSEDVDTSLRDIVVSANGSGTLIKPTETVQLEVKFFPESTTERDVEWQSLDEQFATVNESGLVTAVRKGSAIIEAKSKTSPSVKHRITITVLSPDAVFLQRSGKVEGVWPENAVVTITDQIEVEQGKTLTVEEGVTILIQHGLVGESQAPIEFFVQGSLYLKGTEESPILVTVADESLRNPQVNKYAGLWGGFVGGQNFQELLFEHVTVEYTGAMVRQNSPSVIHELNVADKDRTAAILTDNPDGKIVVLHSTFRYAESDAMYFMGGKAIIANNIIHTIGETDNDGINMKAGVEVDIAYNLTFSVNSNALKLSSSGQGPGREQVVIRAYNNTIVNSGWRRTKNLKGGSIFLEKNALASVYNNLIVNSKLMLKTPSLNNPNPDNGAAWGSVVDYNFYASGSQTMTVEELTKLAPSILTAFDGYTFNDPEYWHDWARYETDYPSMPLIDKNSLVATSAGSPDPKFVNFPFNTVPLHEDMFNTAWNFHVAADSPVIHGHDGYSPKKDGFTDESFAPRFGVGKGLTVDGKTYTTPPPSGHYGAFGVE